MGVNNKKKHMAAAAILALIAVVVILQPDEDFTNVNQVVLDHLRNGNRGKAFNVERNAAKKGDELISGRGKNVRQFKGVGNEIRAFFSNQLQHFYNDSTGVWGKIDLTIYEVDPQARGRQDRQFDKYVNAGHYRSSWFDAKPWDYTFSWGDSTYAKYEALFDTGVVSVQTDHMTDGVKQTITTADSTIKELRWLIESNIGYRLENNSIIYGGDECRVAPPWGKNADGTFFDMVVSLHGDTLIYNFTPESYPITIDPTTLFAIAATGNGATMNSDATYLTARNSVTADELSDTQYHGQQTGYKVLRVHQAYDTSDLPDNAIVTAVKYSIGVMTGDFLTDDYDIHVVESTVTGGALASSWFNDFAGWVSSGVYSITDFANVVNTSAYSANDSIQVTLNASGRAAISLTDTTRFVILSGEDINASAPSNAEWLALSGGHYLQITYITLPTAPTDFAIDNAGIAGNDSLHVTFTKTYPDNVTSVEIRESDSTIVATLDPTDTDGFVAGRDLGTQYTFHMKIDSLGHASYSNLATGTTLPNKPTIDITAVTTTSVTFSIGANSNSSSIDYAIRRHFETGERGFVTAGLDTGAVVWQTIAEWGSVTLSNYISEDDVQYIEIQAAASGGISPTSDFERIGFTARDTTHDVTINVLDAWSINPPLINNYDLVRAVSSDDSIQTDQTGDIFVGQNTGFYVGRIGMEFVIPPMTTITSAILTLDRAAAPTNDFEILTREGEWIPGATLESAFYTWDGWGIGDTEYTGDPMTISLTTVGLPDPFDLTFMVQGLNRINALSQSVVNDTLRLVIFSDQDSLASAPSLSENFGFDANNPFILASYDSTEVSPTGFAATAVSNDTLYYSFTNGLGSNAKLLIVDGTTGDALSDTLTQDATTGYIAGLDPNVLYTAKVKVLGGVHDGDLSNSDAEYSLPNTPGIPTRTKPSNDSLKVVVVPNGNPAWTEFLVMVTNLRGDTLSLDAVAGSLVVTMPFFTSATTITDSAYWGTYADYGSGDGVTVPQTAGAIDSVHVFARSGQ